MNKLTLIFFSLSLLFACKNSKNLNSSTTAKRISSKELQKNMQNAAFQFDFLQAKARVNYNDGSSTQSFTANFRIKQNEKIWISLTGPFGIEGGRVLIEKDRIQIIDKLNNKYYDEKLSYIKNYIPFDVDLVFLQNIILGNNIQDNFEKQKLELKNNSYLVNDNFNGIFAEYLVSDNYRYKKIDLTDSNGDRSVHMQFSDYRYVENALFAMVREILFKENNKQVNLALNFNKIKKENNLDFPFNVPNKLKNN